MSYSCNLVLGMALIFGPLSPGWGEDSPKQDEKLRAELLELAEKDQKARQQLLQLMARKDAEAVKMEIQAATKTVQEIDTLNTARMKEVVDKHGWPGKSLVGTDGSQKAWLLVQHADQDRAFQKRCLRLLGEAVKYLTDRVRVADKKKQVYGTQFHQAAGKMEPYPIEDEGNVDKRRKEIGLPPLAEYRKMLDELYQPKAKDTNRK
jgi:hypothetical protein